MRRVWLALAVAFLLCAGLAGWWVLSRGPNPGLERVDAHLRAAEWNFQVVHTDRRGEFGGHHQTLLLFDGDDLVRLSDGRNGRVNAELIGRVDRDVQGLFFWALPKEDAELRALYERFESPSGERLSERWTIGVESPPRDFPIRSKAVTEKHRMQ